MVIRAIVDRTSLAMLRRSMPKPDASGEAQMAPSMVIMTTSRAKRGRLAAAATPTIGHAGCLHGARWRRLAMRASRCGDQEHDHHGQQHGAGRQWPTPRVARRSGSSRT